MDGKEIHTFRHYPYVHYAIFLCDKENFTEEDLRKAVDNMKKALGHYSYETYKVYHNFMYFCRNLFGDDEAFIQSLKIGTHY